ncbi:MAG: putative DNA binding domain-containing protein [Alphaproteobacteria bacterium]|nr:putative DNA binding domain-containing protein [Alphaproteobacteria bacterium]
MIEKKEMSSEESQKVIDLEEGHYLDVKRIDIKPSKLTETISAFANTSGGEIFLGIREENKNGEKLRSWLGFEDMEAANAHIQVLDQIGGLGNHYRAIFLSCSENIGHVLHLTILKTKDILKASNDHPYIRRNAQNIKIKTQEEIQRLKLDKGIVTFEDETLNIDKIIISNSNSIIEFCLNVTPSSEPEPWLRSQFLINNENPTVAGVLLFSDEPQAALPKRSAIKIYRYKSREDEGTRDTLAFPPITIEGSLYSLIYKSVAETKKIVEDIKKLGTDGLESISYPDETLHEVVTNAVLHRDYSIASDIHIRIYDNRIEVESPGKLPGHVTVSNILHEQSARNPKIVRIINKFPDPPNKDVGEGLNTAFEAMKKLRLREPQIQEHDNSLVVHIAHTPLASPEDTVMKYLESHETITNGVGRVLTGIRSENTMKDVFLRLNKRQLLERVPGLRGNAAAWRRYSSTAND